jgi:hypothetical protein
MSQYPLIGIWPLNNKDFLDAFVTKPFGAKGLVFKEIVTSEKIGYRRPFQKNIQRNPTISYRNLWVVTSA